MNRLEVELGPKADVKDFANDLREIAAAIDNGETSGEGWDIFNEEEEYVKED